MLECYRSRDWASAVELLHRCRHWEQDFALGGFYEMFEQRLIDFLDHEPDADWDGVFIAITK